MNKQGRYQSDSTMRVVALTNLMAMCERIGGVCHKFSVVRVSAARVTVEYSNPNEYGSPDPVRAVLPCFPLLDDKENASVVLHPISFGNCSGRNEGAEQAFEQLWDCPSLYRESMDSDVWRSEYEILVAKRPEFTVTSEWDKYGCIQTWHCLSSQFNSWMEAQAFAVKAGKDSKTIASACV